MSRSPSCLTLRTMSYVCLQLLHHVEEAEITGRTLMCPVISNVTKAIMLLEMIKDSLIDWLWEYWATYESICHRAE